MYGVRDMKKLFGREYMGILRTTFIIEHGIIQKIFLKPKNKAHAEEIMQMWYLVETRNSKFETYSGNPLISSPDLLDY